MKYGVKGVLNLPQRTGGKVGLFELLKRSPACKNIHVFLQTGMKTVKHNILCCLMILSCFFTLVPVAPGVCKSKVVSLSLSNRQFTPKIKNRPTYFSS